MPDRLIPARFDAAFAALKAQLACPSCRGELRMDADRLTCTKCGAIYPIVDGIPVLIVNEQGVNAAKVNATIDDSRQGKP